MLTEFDGYTWSRGGAQSFHRPPVRTRGAPVDYTVTLEPTGQTMLFALDMVENWTPGLAGQAWDFRLRTRRPINAVLRYEARSYPRYVAGADISALALRNAACSSRPAAIRARSNSRCACASEAGSDAAYVQAVLDLFREQEFYYTLTPPGLARDSVDDFLFNTRQGFCGHIASAFTQR